MVYKSIYSYPPEEREKIRARWREAQRRYRPRYKAKHEALCKHFEELLRKEQEAKNAD